MAEQTTVTVSIPKAGEYVYVKEGVTAFFYDDDKCTKQVGPSGGKGGQENSPHNNANEMMGIATGKVSMSGSELFSVEVDWVNVWYQEPKSKKGFWWNPIFTVYNVYNYAKGATLKKEDKKSWVKASQTYWGKVYAKPDAAKDDPLKDTLGGGAGGGEKITGNKTSAFDTNWILYGALAATVLYKFGGKILKR